MKDDRVYLNHIRDSIKKIETYTGKGRKAFFHDSLIQDGVIRNLEIIGEAVRKLSADLKKQHPAIPWRSITALRNVLIHEYFGVDLEAVWRVVRNRIPVLKRYVQMLLQ
jgi:uncharacterized protein with HEPN domain